MDFATSKSNQILVIDPRAFIITPKVTRSRNNICYMFLEWEENTATSEGDEEVIISGSERPQLIRSFGNNHIMFYTSNFTLPAATLDAISVIFIYSPRVLMQCVMIPYFFKPKYQLDPLLDKPIREEFFRT